MMITADVKSGQCSVCQQGVTNEIPVLEMGRSLGMRVWQVCVCRPCAAEMRRHLDEFVSPKDD
jgi:hypothetical protein